MKRIIRNFANKLDLMYNPSTIANYFVTKYGKEGELTPMKLLKLTYIAQGWYLALTDGKQKLIDEDVEAWDYGPVFPSLYRNLRQYGRKIVTDSIPNSTEKKVTETDAKFLDTIWSRYGVYDGVVLSAMTHTDGTPWKEYYGKSKNAIIPTKVIFDHYKSKIKVA